MFSKFKTFFRFSGVSYKRPGVRQRPAGYWLDKHPKSDYNMLNPISDFMR